MLKKAEKSEKKSEKPCLPVGRSEKLVKKPQLSPSTSEKKTTTKKTSPVVVKVVKKEKEVVVKEKESKDDKVLKADELGM